MNVEGKQKGNTAFGEKSVAGGSRDCIVPNTKSDSWCAPFQGCGRWGTYNSIEISRTRNLGQPPLQKQLERVRDFPRTTRISHPVPRSPSIVTKRDVLRTRVGRLATINRWIDRTDTKRFRKNFLRVVAIVVVLRELGLRKCGSGREPYRAAAASLIWVAGLAFP